MSRIRFHFLYFLSWIGFFFLFRLVFLIYYNTQTTALDQRGALGTFLYGIRLDASFAAYICVFPFLLFIAALFFRSVLWRTTVKIYNTLLVVVLSFVQVVDLGLYKAWGFRLDATPLQYLNSPTEMAASAAGFPLLLLALIWMVMSFGGFLLFVPALKSFPKKPEMPEKRKWALPVAGLFLLALLVLPMRGGWQQIPINQSAVYFSESQFANHAALNVPWNVMHALIRNDYMRENPFELLPPDEAANYVRGLYPALPSQPDTLVSADSARKPNVLLIILESFTANHVGALGAKEAATPNLDSLAKDGLLFTNIFASGDRSEKGLAAILSGYPAQPTTSVMKVPRKSERLPYLSRKFSQAGYSTSYYYGGELGFANLKSYLLNGGFDSITEKADFHSKYYNSKWGVHDHVLFNRVLEELPEQKKPFFATVFTLSSHEPYEIPVKPYYIGKDEPTQFKNSIRYTDEALGDFIRAAKKQPWWDNTLVVIVADHGHRFPQDVANHSSQKFRIPLVFTGGALAIKGKNTLTGSQTDLATTLLRHLRISDSDFIWGKDLLNPASPPYAFYVFNNGFGFVTDSSSYLFDNVSRTVFDRVGKVTDEDIKKGKAYMQVSYQDFLNR